MNTKTILASKTFWVQVLGLASMLAPPVREWVEKNPVDFAAAWAALNVLVRFATSGKVSLAGGGDVKTTGNLPSVIAMVSTAAGLGTALPSCTPAQLEAFGPVQGCVQTDEGMVCYSSNQGLTIEVDGRSAK